MSPHGTVKTPLRAAGPPLDDYFWFRSFETPSGLDGFRCWTGPYMHISPRIQIQVYLLFDSSSIDEDAREKLLRRLWLDITSPDDHVPVCLEVIFSHPPPPNYQACIEHCRRLKLMNSDASPLHKPSLYKRGYNLYAGFLVLVPEPYFVDKSIRLLFFDRLNPPLPHEDAETCRHQLIYTNSLPRKLWSDGCLWREGVGETYRDIVDRGKHAQDYYDQLLQYYRYALIRISNRNW
ncbi:hypothetical protein B0J12DRAFT_316151 [Macrophomina phaseolina]|uniref:Uncharacterized protein n=1 Tax=Macrophomina phaseolina TaxID=35725 RepID=A0ABQ8FWL3_9PEZI|nr:hypothetical protein B0J12DRAFT_316151 [Macrophomina phaseolina]